MKRILVVSEVFWPENFLINDLVQQWDRDGVCVEVLTQWPSYPEGRVYDGYLNEGYKKEMWGSVTIHRFKFVEGYKDSKIKKCFNYLKFVREGKRVIKKLGTDFDHIFVHQTGPLTQALPAVYLSRKHNIPMTLWTLDLWPEAIFAYGFPRVKPLEMFVDSIIKRVYNNCEQIFVSSKNFSDTVKKYAPSKNVVYIPNWLMPSDSVSSNLRLPEDKFNFTFTGNMSISQNLHNVILGFNKAKIEGAQLNIVGNGSSFDSVAQLISDEKIENVVLHGRLPFNEMDDIMSQSEVLVISLISKAGLDKTEPFKLQSYLKSGKPILGAIGGGGKEIIDEEELGETCSADDIVQISEAFKKMYLMPQEKIDRIGINAQRVCDTRFNREKIILNINSYIGLGER